MNRRKQYFKVLIAFCSLLILLFINTCQKIELTREAFVQTGSYNVGNGVVTLTGTIIDLGEGISDHGFILSNVPDQFVSSGIKLPLGAASQTGQFTYNLSEVRSGANLYFRAFATSGEETIYGETSNFSTPALIVSTQTATIQNKSSAILNGIISDLGFESVTEHGFYWAANNFTPQNFAETRIELGPATETTTFNFTLTGLTPYEKYFFVAFAENENETKFGSVGSFKMENLWTRIGNFEGNARYRALAFSLEDLGYITGGHDTGPISDFYQFTPDPENWTFLSSGSSPVNGTAFTIGNKAYVINEPNNLYEFDPVEGIWVAKTPFPGLGRWNMFAFGIGNKGYVGSGEYWNGEQYVCLNDFWEFDPQDDITGVDINGDPMGSWVQKADFQGTGRQFGEGFSIAGLGYVCSGYNSGDLDDFWQYDPESTDNGTDDNGNPMGAWYQKTDYPGILGTPMVSFVIDLKAYLFNYELWQYDPGTENWTKMRDFPGHPRYAPVGFAINNNGYIGTGVYDDGGTNVFLDDFWEYLPHQ